MHRTAFGARGGSDSPFISARPPHGFAQLPPRCARPSRPRAKPNRSSRCSPIDRSSSGRGRRPIGAARTASCRAPASKTVRRSNGRSIPRTSASSCISSASTAAAPRATRCGHATSRSCSGRPTSTPGSTTAPGRPSFPARRPRGRRHRICLQRGGVESHLARPRGRALSPGRIHADDTALAASARRR